MNVYGGNRSTDPLILNHDTLWRYVVNFTSRPLYPGKEMQCPLNMELGGDQILFGSFKVEKNLFSLSSFELRTVQPAAL